MAPMAAALVMALAHMPVHISAEPVGISFNASFGSFMVLQQQPAKACIYGMLGEGGNAASVRVSEAGTTLETITARVDGGMWKACIPPKPPGGDYSIAVTCSGCINSTAAIIEHVTFGDVWFCSGQSNMALSLVHTYSRNESRAAILAGKYSNIRIQALAGNMNPEQRWTTLRQALAAAPAEYEPAMGIGNAGTNAFEQYSATCYYYGQSLTDELEAAGRPTVPLGLIHTAWGGSTIEQWLSNESVATCADASTSAANSEWHVSRVEPYLSMTVKGWVWYQGENNCHGTMGSAAAGVGYSCLMETLVAQWRLLWSRTPNTTNPDAPFGIVTLASSGSEGASGHALGAMRLAQTAGHGVLPAPSGVMANTFLAQAFDLDDQWSGDRGPCTDVGWNKSSPAWNCCGRGGPDNATCMHSQASTCRNMCYASTRTRQLMGSLHPRSKKPVGLRLARAAFNTVYGGGGSFTGPTLAGCTLTATKLTIRFDEALLNGDSVVVKEYAEPNFTPYYHGHGNPMWNGGSQLYVQTIASSFCIEPMRSVASDAASSVYCPIWAGGDGTNVTQPSPSGRFPTFGGNGASTANDPKEFNEGWINLPVAAGTASTVTVDLSALKGEIPTSVRYGWGILNCCDLSDPTTFTSKDCIANCPIMASSGLPANPFIAKIEGGRCKCVPPQKCDS